MRTTRFARDLLAAALAIGLTTPSADGQSTTRVSVDSAGAEANDFNSAPSISDDGQIVAFASSATNLVASDTYGFHDVFVHDRATGTTERVSVDSSGREANGDSHNPVISGDGRFVAFNSSASSLVGGDVNNDSDVFVHDRVTRVTERVSVDSRGHEGDGGSAFPSISADGRFVSFFSNATNLVSGDTNGVYDVFVRDRALSRTERVSVDSAGTQGNGDSMYDSISPDGRCVGFRSAASNLVAGDNNRRQDVFVHDRITGATERVSVSSTGAEGLSDSFCGDAMFSRDGRFVAFTSLSSNLVPGDTNSDGDVFVRDRVAGVTERVSVDSTGAQSSQGGAESSISDDGMTVCFTSYGSDLVANDTNSDSDIFVHSRATGITERVSVDSTGLQSNGDSHSSCLSADGRFVAFNSAARNLVAGDGNSTEDDFVRERCSTDATWSSYGAGFPGTLGIPSFAARVDPVVGTTVPLDLGNSYGLATVGVAAIGFAEAFVPTSKGGVLLVAPASWIVVALPPAGAAIEYEIPGDHALCGRSLFVQAFELDPGAAKGFSFTAGLELVIGH